METHNDKNSDCVDCDYGACTVHENLPAQYAQPATRLWSTQQAEIFDFFATGRGNLAVDALAGTGKTTTIIEACKYATHEAKILLGAFNTRIKLELERKSVGLKNVEVKTLHGLGFAYIRQQWRQVTVDGAVDWDRANAACGKDAPEEIVSIVKKLAGQLKNMAPLTYDVNVVADIAEQFDCTPSEENIRDGWDLARICRTAGKARDAALDRDPKNRISFDDMVYIPLGNDWARPWFTMVIIDEAQDMNASQLMLALRACKRQGRIVVVGDENQAIYAFRGADSGGIARLKRELNAKVLGLTTTYRCGKAIVDVARALVPHFEAGPSNPQGLVDTVSYEGIFDAAKPGDFIVSRKNAPLMALCLGFLKRGVRARIEGRDIGKALRETVSKFKADSVPRFIERVQGWAAKQGKKAAKLKGEEARQAKLDEINDQVQVLTALAEGCNSVGEILTRCDTLFGEVREETAPSVVLTSVHKVKGLEAGRVFVLADTVSTRNVEEQNIYYVAVTRAKLQLTWVVRA